MKEYHNSTRNTGILSLTNLKPDDKIMESIIFGTINETLQNPLKNSSWIAFQDIHKMVNETNTENIDKFVYLLIYNKALLLKDHEHDLTAYCNSLYNSLIRKSMKNGFDSLLTDEEEFKASDS